MNKILADFLNPEKSTPQKIPTLRRVPPTLEQFRDDHPASALMALERNALAFESYQREQRRRPRVFRPFNRAAQYGADRRAA